jgi:hypothetical protein
MADLEAHRTRFVILDSGPGGNPLALPPPATPLDAYLQSRFVPGARYPLTPPGLFRAYTILVRKPGA